MLKAIKSFFKPTPAPVVNNPLDLGNGITITTVDEGGYIQMSVNLPPGAFVSYVYAGREVFRIDQNGGRNI